MREYYIIINDDGLYYYKHRKEWVSVPSLWVAYTYAKKAYDKLNEKVRKVTLKINEDENINL